MLTDGLAWASMAARSAVSTSELTTVRSQPRLYARISSAGIPSAASSCTQDPHPYDSSELSHAACSAASHPTPLTPGMTTTDRDPRVSSAGISGARGRGMWTVPPLLAS